MSNLMDPGGADRIIKQQIKEWYAELDQERNAKLLDPPPHGIWSSVFAPVRWARDAVVGKVSSLGHRAPQEPITMARPASDPQRELAEGHR